MSNSRARPGAYFPCLKRIFRAAALVAPEQFNEYLGSVFYFRPLTAAPTPAAGVKSQGLRKA